MCCVLTLWAVNNPVPGAERCHIPSPRVSSVSFNFGPQWGPTPHGFLFLLLGREKQQNWGRKALGMLSSQVKMCNMPQLSLKHPTAQRTLLDPSEILRWVLCWDLGRHHPSNRDPQHTGASSCRTAHHKGFDTSSKGVIPGK